MGEVCIVLATSFGCRTCINLGVLLAWAQPWAVEISVYVTTTIGYEMSQFEDIQKSSLRIHDELSSQHMSIGTTSRCSWHNTMLGFEKHSI